jgi:dTDP-3-amino-3,4,6-trideoxy-alpha-D-glucose transaminase
MSPPVPFLDMAAGIAEQRAGLEAAIARVLDSGSFIMGPELAAFEAEFAAFCGCDAAVGVGNGLDALAMALEASGVGPGDEVVVPAHTFIATWSAVAMIGAVPVPAEPAGQGYNVDAATIAAAMTPRTRAIVVVHLYGEPVAMEDILALAAEHAVPVIEDAAQAHGATRHGVPAGSLGRAAAFSFYPSKNLGALGDGGAVTTNDPAIAARVRLLRNYGSVRKYDHETGGRNSRLDPLQAAVLRLRLTRLTAWNAARGAVAAAYLEGLADLPGLTLPPVVAGNAPAWHLFVVQVDEAAGGREALAATLEAQDITTLIHYPRACYRYPPFARSGPEGATRADRLAQTVLSLQIGPHQSPEQTARVIAAVRDAVRCARRG